MGYSFLYLLIFMMIIMFVLRIFLPIVIWLLPVFIVLWLITTIFRSRPKRKDQTTTYDQTYYQQDTYQQQSSNPDIIDVDYKVVDEKQDGTH